MKDVMIVIPAKGNSKRLPGKNMLEINGVEYDTKPPTVNSTTFTYPEPKSGGATLLSYGSDLKISYCDTVLITHSFATATIKIYTQHNWRIRKDTQPFTLGWPCRTFFRI